jgi:serine/threonine protein kinase
MQVNNTVSKFCNYVKKENMLRGCSEDQMKKIATYVEEKFKKKVSKGTYYIDGTTSHLPAALEYDPKTKHTFIHFFNDALGEGYWKKGTYSILYDIERPVPCIRLTLKDDKLKKSPEAMKEFEAEIGRSKMLQHDTSHIVRTFAAIPYNKGRKDRMALIQELYPQGSLDKLLSKKSELLTTARKIKIASGILSGLKEIHDKGYLHRDLHSGNIYLDKEFKAYIGDFGWALRQDRAKDVPAQSHSKFAAPELLAKGKTTSKDYKLGELFTAGQSLYHLTFGEKLDLEKGKGWSTLYRKIEKVKNKKQGKLVKKIQRNVEKITKVAREHLEKKVAAQGEDSLSAHEMLEMTTLQLLNTDVQKRKTLQHWIAFLEKAQQKAG